MLSFGGPAITIRSRASNPATAVTPKLLAGVASKDLKGLDKSYFKVIRAVSEIESSGRLDVMNAYDAAVQSLGPFQQTIIASTASKPRTIGNGELPAFLSEVMSLPDSWLRDWFQMHGMRLPAWDENSMRDTQAKKYTAPILRETEAGQEPNNWQEVPQEREVAEQFRHWHWTYRLAMLARTHRGCQQTFWTACKRRVDDILSTPWGALPTGSTWPKTTCIGDVFRSETSVAMLLRVHVNAPGYVCSTNAGPFVKLAFTQSKIPANTALAALPEDKLVDGLLSAVAIPGAKKVRKGAPWLTNDLYALYSWKGWSDGGDSQDDLKLDRVFVRK